MNYSAKDGDARSRADAREACPLIVVGQSRSGSTLLAAILNRGGHAFIVNDAYFVQRADGLVRDGRLTSDAAREFTVFCLDALEKGIARPGQVTVDRPLELSAEDWAALEREAMARAEHESDWTVIMESLVRAAAARAGRPVWGWNTPADYVHVDRLLELYPRARILFLIRNPFDVVRSYKFLPRYWGTERLRYHPVLQSLVWRRATEQYEIAKRRHGAVVKLIRYEDMTAFSDAFRADLSAFLGFEVPAMDLLELGSNSSHGQSGKPRTLTRAEIAITRSIAGPGMQPFGYSAADAPDPRGLGLFGLGVTTARAGWYYLAMGLGSRDMRKRIRRLLSLDRSPRGRTTAKT